MAIISVNKKQFEREIGKLDEKMQHKISMFGTPIENITEDELQLEIFPNRPDLLSYHGFKRAFLSFIGKKVGLKEYKINKPEKNYEVIIDKSVNDVRPFTACAIVKGLKLDDEKIKEIIEIQEKLHMTMGRKRKKLAIGIYPLEKIKLPINYMALEPDKIKFIPLETEREMSGLEILQRHPAGRDYAHLLAGKVKFPIFIDSEKNILSMPPIINSKLTGKITEETKDIFIECSGFDFNTLKKCLNILVSVFAEMGGQIYQMELKYLKKEITPDLETEKLKINIETTNKLLGLDLKEKQIKELLEKMGYNYSKGEAEIASWRTDVLHEVDLIEDIAIAYGYDNLIPEIPSISTIGEESKKESVKRKIAEILNGVGFLELSNYHLTIKNDQFKKMGLPEKEFIEIEDSKTEYNLLRKDLSHYAIKIFAENVDSEYPQKVFETGKIFEEKGKITEKERLCIGISPGSFTEIKQTLEYLFKMMNKTFEMEESHNFPGYYIEGRVAEIKINNKSAGFVGEVHPKILKNWRVKMPIALLEIDLEEIFN